MSDNLHQRAKEIFGKLVDLPREVQAKELEKLCAGDPQLRHEVGSLLDFHTARSLMAEPPKPKIRNRSTLSTTRLRKSWLQRALAYLPILALILLLTAAILPLTMYISAQVESNNDFLVEQKLNSVISDRASQLDAWYADKRSALLGIASKPSVLEQLQNSQVDANEIQRSIEEALAGSATFCLWDKQMRLLSRTQVATDVKEIPGWTPFRCTDLMSAAGGKVIVRIPVPGQYTLPPPLNNVDATAFCPVKSPAGEVVATLVIQSPVIGKSFEELVAKWNEKAEETEAFDTYVVDCKGHLISQTRFPERLRQLNELVRERSSNELKSSESKSTQSIQGTLIQDPGKNLLVGEVPETHPASWQLTRSVQGIADSKDGTSTEGYRNYIGLLVVGAWRYLPQDDLGIIVELPRQSAFKFVADVNWTLTILMGLCTLGTLIGVVVSWPRRTTRGLRTVGPYKIQELLGEGGMGKVYLAEHSLLCRPTAIKILSSEITDLSVLMRFEREVQLASQLTHPNTISIYDFGRNEEGLFYYAMEYIDGGHIGQLVEFDGPLPAGRCIYLIRQLCFALREAHLAGVVHRDIKPQNVMLCDRGGEPDFIKLVDYGLVKAFAPGISDVTSQTNVIIGTPRFMAPERLQSPWLADPRVDIYSIGGMLYFMLTADLPPLVTPTGSQESAQLGVETLDLKNSAIPFSGLLSHCMSCDPATRPSSISTLLHELDVLSVQFPWSREDSEQWWKKRGAKFKQFLATKRNKV
ncbi:MAG: serine/threonine-protein kinase [Pirellulaceae bacterium]|nr:serine/threonine-protein kinase [Pirellulaceae bacterium]